MAFVDNKRLFDIATRLQVYVEGVKAQQSLEFQVVLSALFYEFKKLLTRINYATLDGLTKAELNKLVIDLRKAQAIVYSHYSKKILDQLQAFMMASLKVNRIAYTSAFVELQQDESDELFIPSDAKAAQFIAEENDSSEFIALFGLAAISAGSASLWPKLTAMPIAANGALLQPFVKSFTLSAQAGLENIVRKGYSNAWTITETAAEAFKQLERVAVQETSVISTVLQHIAGVTSAAVTSALFGKYRWISVLDSGTTDICISRSGKVYRYGEGPLPPAHIRCRSHIIPYRANYEDETFYTWIKRQPTDLQNFALGNKAAQMLRAGKLNSKDVIRLSRTQYLTIEQFGNKAEEIITGKKPK